MNVSSKFYPDDPVVLKTSPAFQGKVLATDDTKQTVLVEWSSPAIYQGREQWVPGNALRVPPPHEVAVS